MGLFDFLRGRSRSDEQVEKRAAGDSDSAVVGDLPLSQQYQRIGGNLTPQQVSSIIQEADGGNIRRFIDLLNEARQKDGHLHAVLQTRELALKSLKWEVVVDSDEPDDAATAAAKECTRAFRKSRNFPELVAWLNGATYPGHATAETMWQTSDERRRIDPGWFKLISPRRFVFGLDDGKLLFSDAGGSATGVDLVEDFPGKFIQYQPVLNHDVPAREGLGRVLAWAALFRNWSVRDWLQLGEIGWKPWRMGTYKKTAHQTDIDKLRDVLQRMATTGAAVFPETTDITIEWPKSQVTNTTSPHRELFDAVGREMSKATIGATLSVEAGDRGARALGDVHEAVRGDILVSDAVGVASILQQCLVSEWYALNVPPNVERGAFIFHTEDAVDLKTFAMGIEALVRAGVRIPQKWIRNQSAIPDPKDGEEIAVMPQATSGSDEAA